MLFNTDPNKNSEPDERRNVRRPKRRLGGQSLRRNGLTRAYLKVDVGDGDNDDPGTCLERLNKTTINLRINRYPDRDA